MSKPAPKNLVCPVPGCKRKKQLTEALCFMHWRKLSDHWRKRIRKSWSMYLSTMDMTDVRKETPAPTETQIANGRLLLKAHRALIAQAVASLAPADPAPETLNLFAVDSQENNE